MYIQEIRGLLQLEEPFEGDDSSWQALTKRLKDLIELVGCLNTRQEDTLTEFTLSEQQPTMKDKAKDLDSG